MSFPYPKPFPGASLFAIAAVASAVGGAALISGEDQGLGIDFTYSDRAAQMEVLDTGTPANSGTFDPFSKLTYTSPSVKLCRQSDGVWRYGNHNLVLQSQTLGTTWSTNQTTISANSTTAPDGTSTADTLIEDGNNSRHQIEQQMVGRTPASIPITLSVYAKATGAGSTRYLYLTLYGFDYSTAIYDLTSSGSVSKTQSGQVGTILASSITSVGSGWYRCSITVNDSAADKYAIMGLSNSGTATISNGDVSYAGDSTSGLYLWGAECKRYPVSETGPTINGVTGYIATTSAAKYDLPYEWDEDGVLQGIKPEEARTNLCLRSQEIDNASWDKNNATVSTNAATAPDGTTTADKIVETASNANHFITQTIDISDNTNYTLSLFAKAAELNTITIELDTSEFSRGVYVTFDLTDGSFVPGTYGDADAIYVGAVAVEETNGWWRLSLTARFGSMGDTAQFTISISQGDGDGSSGLYVWGTQLEAGSFATSPIHTIGATVTRAADQISLPTSTFPYSDTEFTVYSDAAINWGTNNGAGLYAYLWCLFEGGFEFTGLALEADRDLAAESYHLSFGSNQIGGATYPMGKASLAGVPFKTAVAMKSNDSSACMDGGAQTTDTLCSMPADQTDLYLGYNGTDSQLNGYLRTLTFIPRRATNTELQTRTAA